MPNTPKLLEWEKTYHEIMMRWIEKQWELEKAHQNGEPYTRMKFEAEAVKIEGELKKLFSQELSTLKAQVRKEIEELKREHKPCYGKSACDCPGCIAESVRNQTLDDCLSIPSLKGKQQ